MVPEGSLLVAWWNLGRLEELDNKLLAWLLENLRAGRAAVFQWEGDRVELRARLGQSDPFSEQQLGLIREVAETGLGQTLDQAVCLPLHGSQLEVVGVLHLDLPFDNEVFSEYEWGFCRRCARWLEVARLGRAHRELPLIKEGRTESEKPKKSTKVGVEKFSHRLDRPEVFFRSLYTMVDAGLPLHESLYFLGESADGEGARRIATEMADGISRGLRLSVVMTRFPAAFSPYHVGLVRIGESTGSLALVLKITAEHLEASSKLSQKIKSALTYPSILVAGTLFLLTMAPSWLLKGQLEMLKSSKVELPFLTRALMNWSELCRSPLFLFFLLLVLVSLVTLLSRKKVRRKLLGLSHSVPGLKKIVRTAGAARFARALSISLKAGVSLLEGVVLSAESTGDPVYEQVMETTRERLVAGETLAESLAFLEVFPAGFVQVVEAGEYSGKLVSLLELMADLYEMEVEVAVKSLTVLLEPMLLLFIGVFTALVLIATLQPTILVLQTI